MGRKKERVLRASYRHQGLPATPRSSEREARNRFPLDPPRGPNPSNTQNPGFQSPDRGQQFPLSKGSMVLNITTSEASTVPGRRRCRRKGPRTGPPALSGQGRRGLLRAESSCEASGMPQPTGQCNPIPQTAISTKFQATCQGRGIGSFIHSLFHLTLFFYFVQFFYAVNFTLGLGSEVSVFKSIPTARLLHIYYVLVTSSPGE